MHCIIAYAASAELPTQALQGLHLPRLSALLARLQPAGRDQDPDGTRPPAAMPHERVHARALGWDTEAPLPWAALDNLSADGQAQAWITPCHWQIGMDQVYMLEPAALALRDEESQALLHSLEPYLLEDGLQVRWHDALHWHARGPLLQGWTAPSLDRVIAANVRPWITSGLPAALVRLQSEMQMLAYNHPVNDTRLERGELPVNAFWVHGAGSLSALPQADVPVRCHDELRSSALRGDVQGWRMAWQVLDARLPDPATPGLRLTLCSESAALHWRAGPTPWLGRLRQVLTSPNTSAALQALITP